MNNITAESLLQGSIDILRERATLRDSPQGERSMAKCIDAFNALTGNHLSVLDGWKFMLCLKLSRSSQGRFHLDDYKDLIGYATLAGEEAANEEFNRLDRGVCMGDGDYKPWSGQADDALSLMDKTGD